MAEQSFILLPSAHQLQVAVEQYLRKAYGGSPPAAMVARFLPPSDVDLASWLMRDEVERQPADAELHEVRAFNLRVGNRRYQYMKLRIARPPGRDFFVFTVDAHDAVLQAPSGAPDAAELEELKKYNRHLVQEILEAWDALGVFTERAYLRHEIQQARRKMEKGP
jgi:hypothetical protein